MQSNHVQDICHCTTMNILTSQKLSILMHLYLLFLEKLRDTVAANHAMLFEDVILMIENNRQLAKDSSAAFHQTLPNYEYLSFNYSVQNFTNHFKLQFQRMTHKDSRCRVSNKIYLE